MQNHDVPLVEAKVMGIELEKKSKFLVAWEA
jgi:hypothetical protein